MAGPEAGGRGLGTWSPWEDQVWKCGWSSEGEDYGEVDNVGAFLLHVDPGWGKSTSGGCSAWWKQEVFFSLYVHLLDLTSFCCPALGMWGSSNPWFRHGSCGMRVLIRKKKKKKKSTISLTRSMSRVFGRFRENCSISHSTWDPILASAKVVSISYVVSFSSYIPTPVFSVLGTLVASFRLCTCLKILTGFTLKSGTCPGITRHLVCM